MSEHRFLQGLTPAQAAAAGTVEGALLILAGPGSGKTRTVTHRIAHMIDQGVAPHRILALTFTNKAADELGHRLKTLVPGKNVWAGTFHRFGARLLREYSRFAGLDSNYTIYDSDDSRSCLNRTLRRLKVDTTHLSIERIAHWLSAAKSALLPPEEFRPAPGDPLEAVMARVYPDYQKSLRLANAVDFDDLLLLVAIMLRDQPELREALDRRWQYILVDEYQDTNLAQYAIVRGLSVSFPNLCATGDPDQSIYGWRGANLGNILEFERDFPKAKVVRLEQNFRSTQLILAAADSLIRHNQKRKPKALFTENPVGRPVRLRSARNELDEADKIARDVAEGVSRGRKQSDYAVLYRVNALSLKLELALRRCNIAYKVVQGLAFFQRAEIKDAVSYLQLLNNPRNDVAFQRIINTPPRGIGKKSQEQLEAFANGGGMNLFDAAAAADRCPGLTKKAAAAFQEFAGRLTKIGREAAGSLEELIGKVLHETGYVQLWRDSQDPDDQERLANLGELLSFARDFDERRPDRSTWGLDEFLEQISLASDTDAFEGSDDRVKLMTMHAAKGLEFPCVFIVGLEEGLIPHSRAKDQADGLEEERRLLFVGITRAREELTLSYAREREMRGQRRLSVPSPFLLELPHEGLERDLPESLASHSGRGRAEWEDGVDAAPPEEFPVYDDVDPPPPVEAEERIFSPPPSGFDRPDKPAKKPSKTAPLKASALKTAAELRAGGPAATPAEAFRHDMLVEHPEYGRGRITALSGSTFLRVAVVRFETTGREAKFILSKSPLKPLEE